MDNPIIAAVDRVAGIAGRAAPRVRRFAFGGLVIGVVTWLLVFGRVVFDSRTWFVVTAALLVACLVPGLVLVDFSRALGKAPGALFRVRREALAVAGEGLERARDGLAVMQERRGTVRTVFRAVRELRGLRGVAGKARSVGGAAADLGRLIAPFYLLLVAAAAAMIPVLGFVAVLALAVRLLA